MSPPEGNLILLRDYLATSSRWRAKARITRIRRIGVGSASLCVVAKLFHNHVRPHTNPKRKRGTVLSLTLRVGVSINLADRLDARLPMIERRRERSSAGKERPGGGRGCHILTDRA